MATKEVYQKQFEAQLTEGDTGLGVLSAQTQEATADARIKYEKELNSRRATAHKTLEELSKRSQNAWEDMKFGVQKGWDDISKAIEKAAARFK